MSKQANWRSGFSDGSGPEYVTAGNKTIVKTVWGCSCCQPEAEPEHVALANQIAREHNAHKALVGALQQAQDYIDKYCPQEEWMKDIADALELARGEA